MNLFGVGSNMFEWFIKSSQIQNSLSCVVSRIEMKSMLFLIPATSGRTLYLCFSSLQFHFTSTVFFLGSGSVFVKHLVFASFIPTHSVSWVNHFPLLMGYDGLISLLCGFWWTPCCLAEDISKFHASRVIGNKPRLGGGEPQAPGKSCWIIIPIWVNKSYIYIFMWSAPLSSIWGFWGGGDHIAHMYVLYIYIIIYIYEEWYLNTWNHQRVSDLGLKTSGQQKTGFIGTDWFGIQSMVDSAPT